ncbi:SLC35F6 [Cordylochernes scorpioides]|uniref:SLC35F6 n=1 Tax=Cordylochernes scorpioides TaxID=51811 RepID=A0ABY6KZP0_9ARAC|nr:SLC35F6 [Cordylochernes scorpioides]
MPCAAAPNMEYRLILSPWIRGPYRACAMFVGEALCLGAYYLVRYIFQKKGKPQPPSTDGNVDFKPWIFLPPTLCDMTATSLMYLGLTMTYASSFQMLRGAVIVFTGLLSSAFLQRKLDRNQWIGILIVVVGLAIVGASDIIFPSTGDTHFDTNHLITGDLLIIMAQIVAATQMVLEEKFVSKHRVAPLQAVGLEGTFGVLVLGLLLIPMYYIPVGNMIFHNPKGNLEDAIDGFVQIYNNPIILTAILGTIFSIAFFNFAGLTVTKEQSATSRMVLDSIRTLVIWLVSIGVGWQSFNYLQPIGFVVLLVGMAMYNHIITLDRCLGRSDDTAPLLPHITQQDSSPEIIIMFSIRFPFLQALGFDGTEEACAMFVGEALCLGAYYLVRYIFQKKGKPQPPSTDGNVDFKPWIFLPPTLCDMTATSLMYLGLTMTYASSFQMLRGAVIVFTGLLSSAFLQRKLDRNQWIGILIVVVGLAIVGASDIIFPSTGDTHFDTNHLITGDLLIIMAQIVASTQMVLEEKFVSKHRVAPLQAVGLEGTFGVLVLGLLLIPMYYIPVGNMIFHNPKGNLEDAIDGFVQIYNNPIILTAILGTIFSIAFFNFAGLTVTKEQSATSRMVLDSIRTLVIWLVSIGVGWQSFNYLQPIGFVVLLVGMAMYNHIITLDRCLGRSDDTAPLLPHITQQDSSPEVIS